MNDEDFVSYEIAQAIARCGYDGQYNYMYATECFCFGDNPFIFDTVRVGERVLTCVAYYVNDNYEDAYRGIPCPSLWQAQKWLRERGLCVSVYPSPFSEDIDGEYAYKVYQFMDYEEWNDPCAEYAKDYNSALSAGIEAALKLIENNKNNSVN